MVKNNRKIIINIMIVTIFLSIALLGVFTSEVYAADGASNLRWDKGIAKWDKGTSATKYRICLYCNGKEIYYTGNTYLTATSKDFSQYILPGNSYKFRVYSYTSEGRGLGFNDSPIYTLGGSLGEIYNIKIYRFDNLAVTWNSIANVDGYEIILKKSTQIIKQTDIPAAPGSPQYFDLKNILPEAGLGNYTITINAYRYFVGNNVATVTKTFQYDEQRIVTFKDKNVILDTFKVNHWAKLERPSNPYKKGYEFDDWYNESNFQAKYDFNSYVKNNTTLYAKFNLKTYNISYNLDGGTQVKPNPTTYTVETPTFVLNDPVKEGYVLSKWVTAYGSPITNGNTIPKGTVGDLSLKAIWEKLYKITYDLKGGTETTNPSTYTSNTPSFTLAKPKKTGYIFKQWKNEKGDNLTDTYTINKGTKGDIKLIAEWVPISQYTITFDFNGGKTGSISNNPYTKVDKGYKIDFNNYKNVVNKNITSPVDKEFDAFEINGKRWSNGTYTVNNNIVIKVLWKNKTNNVQIILGDLNENGKVEANDAFKVLQLSVSGKKFTNDELKIGDINKNGKIDANDAYQILAYSVGIKATKYWK